MNHDSAHGLWYLVIIDSAVFIIVALSFAKPRSRRDWRSLGAFTAFHGAVSCSGDHVLEYARREGREV